MIVVAVWTLAWYCMYGFNRRLRKRQGPPSLHEMLADSPTPYTQYPASSKPLQPR